MNQIKPGANVKQIKIILLVVYVQKELIEIHYHNYV